MEDCAGKNPFGAQNVPVPRAQASAAQSESLCYNYTWTNWKADAKQCPAPWFNKEAPNLKHSSVINTLYRQALGSLMNLIVCTRPDSCFVVGRLSHIREKQSKSLWNAVKRDFRYVAATLYIAIVHAGVGDKPVTLGGFNISYWAGCKLPGNRPLGFIDEREGSHGNGINIQFLLLLRLGLNTWQ